MAHVCLPASACSLPPSLLNTFSVPAFLACLPALHVLLEMEAASLWRLKQRLGTPCLTSGGPSVGCCFHAWKATVLLWRRELYLSACPLKYILFSVAEKHVSVSWGNRGEKLYSSSPGLSALCSLRERRGCRLCRGSALWPEMIREEEAEALLCLKYISH